jgi:hypothetical protein
MFDEKVPRHIRIKAANMLARWRDPCRAEAQALLMSLR